MSTSYVPGIDGLRAIAVFAVVIFHIEFLGFLPGGFTGVDMFFVISGFVISRALAQRDGLPLGAYLLDFYRRRVLRILPALLTVLVVSFVLSALLVPPVWLSDQNDNTGLAAVFGLSNVVLAWNLDTYFSPSAEFNPYLHTWSLGVEEQFYLIFPLLFFVWLRRRQQGLLAWMLLPVAALLSLVLCAVQTTRDPLAAFYLLPARFWELAAGALLFQLMSVPGFVARCRSLARPLLVSGALLLAAGLAFAEQTHFPFPWAMLTVLGTLLLISAVVTEPGGSRWGLRRLLRAAPVTYLGRLSYSLYLWHWPLAVFVRWTVGMEQSWVPWAYPPVLLALAAASYHWIETPARRGRSALHRRPGLTLAGAVAGVGLAAGAGVWITANTERLSLSQVSDSYTWQAYKHYPQEPLEVIEDSAMQGRRLFVMGDSHTAAYRTLLNIVALRLGVEVVEYERGGCPVISLMDADPPRCAASRQAALGDLLERAQAGDIVFLASLRMPELKGRDWRQGDDQVLAAILAQQTPERSEAAYESAEALLQRLTRAGLTVLIDAPKPLFKAPPNRCSDGFNRMNPVCAPGFDVSREWLEALRAPQMNVLARLSAQFPALQVWDPLPILCPGSLCSAYDDQGKPLFNDSDHLSAHGNRILEPAFTQHLLTRVTPHL